MARDPSDKYAAFPRRHSYLIDPDGRIHRAYDVTDVARHADQIILDVEEASGRR